MQEILERDRQARERAARYSGPARLIGRVGGFDRGVAIDLDERMQMGILRIDLRQAGFDDRARARLAARQHRGERGQRMEREIVGHGGHGMRRDGRNRTCTLQRRSVAGMAIPSVVAVLASACTILCILPQRMDDTGRFRTAEAREMEPLVLTVDVAGLPQAWVELEEAITYHAKQMVAWSVGREVREFRGGWQKNGVRSRIATRSILAIKGSGAGAHRHAPGLTNQMLFVRDRQVCAYCGGRFMVRELSRDHVVPVSRGGKDAWTNTVTACRSCNTRKGGRSPEQAGMPLLYVPYVPNRHEHFILRNRRILADQMEYLLAGVPKTSRLHVREGRAARA